MSKAQQQTIFRRMPDRKLVKHKIPIEGAAVILRDELKGWCRFPAFIGRVKGMKWGFLGLKFNDNTRVMVVNDADAYPISPFRPSKDVMLKQCKTEGDNEMADKQADYQLEKVNKANKQQFFQSAMAFAIIGIVFVTLVVIALFVGGRFNFQVS